MELEIRKINLMSIIFSGFSFMIFFTSLILAIVGIFIVPNPVWLPVSFSGKLIGTVLFTLILFIITLAYAIFIVFVYNFFVSVLGMKGIRVSLEEVEKQE